MTKDEFKKYLENVMDDIQKKLAETYADESNEGLSMFIAKNGYMTAFSFDENGERIKELNILKGV